MAGVTCNNQCQSQCDDCHDLDNCVEATRQYGDLILCETCRAKYPAQQPWRIDPETGEHIDLIPSTSGEEDTACCGLMRTISAPSHPATTNTSSI